MLRKEITWSNEDGAEISFTTGPLVNLHIQINDNKGGVAGLAVPDEAIDDMIELLQKIKSTPIVK